MRKLILIVFVLIGMMGNTQSVGNGIIYVDDVDKWVNIKGGGAFVCDTSCVENVFENFKNDSEALGIELTLIESGYNKKNKFNYELYEFYAKGGYYRVVMAKHKKPSEKIHDGISVQRNRRFTASEYVSFKLHGHP